METARNCPNQEVGQETAVWTGVLGKLTKVTIFSHSDRQTTGKIMKNDCG